MKYSIQITGIHCSGCKNLIKLILVENGLQDVEVTDNLAIFGSNKSKQDLINMLNSAFEKDLQSYNYTNLNIID